jgi:hypothetical protein
MRTRSHEEWILRTVLVKIICAVKGLNRAVLCHAALYCAGAEAGLENKINKEV